MVTIFYKNLFIIYCFIIESTSVNLNVITEVTIKRFDSDGLYCYLFN